MVDGRKAFLFLIAFIAISEITSILYVALVGDLTARVQELENRVSKLELELTAASRVYAAASPSIATVRAVKSDGSTVQGTGVLVDGNGTFVTSYHVVANASGIILEYWDKTASNATFIGGDIYTDIAVVRAACAPNAYPLRFGSQLAVGELVYVIGSPHGLDFSLTVGVVSGVERLVRLAELGYEYPRAAYAIADVIQFDAYVAPGSSGCPMLNSKGEVVGIVFAMREPGIAFATSAYLVKRVVSGILEKGKYEHPWIGISYQLDYIGGLKVLHVYSGSPAERTGLRSGDVVVAVDGNLVRDACEFITFIEKYKSPGDIVNLTVQRDGLIHQMQLQLGARP